MGSKLHYARIAQLPEQSFFLLGVRGVGKSTWARVHLGEARSVDLLDEARFQDLMEDPGRFARELEDLAPGSWVVLDEVQRIPRLLNEVHRLIEAKGLRFALLGSSARKLKSAGTNLLAGRALLKAMHPLTPSEMGSDFDLGAALTHGCIPLVVAAPDSRAALTSYVQLYLREEIRAEALTRNLAGFTRFLPIAGLFHGQILNVSSLSRDAGVPRKTIEGYLDILEDTLMAQRLPAFQAKLRVRERRHPKLYWVDPGLARAVKRQVGPLSLEERGPLFEGWILQLIRAHGEEQDLYEDLSYWAPSDKSKLEVDLLLRRGSEHLAIEVKSGTRYHQDALKGLRAIAELDGLVRRIVVYLGSTSMQTEDGIEIWPLDRFLEALAGGSLWP